MEIIRTRTWLLTSSTYGTWLPGDSRGFVGAVREKRTDDDPITHRTTHNRSGTPYDRGMAGLQAAAAKLMKSDEVRFTAEQATVVLAEFQSTCAVNKYHLHAASVMDNHFHCVVTAADSVPTDELLKRLKSYSSRELNHRFGRRERWWTRSGSRRDVSVPDACRNAIRYVWDQHGWQARWVSELDRDTVADLPA